MKKNKTGLKRFFQICMISPGWILLAVLLGILSSAAYFVPYLAVYKILKNIFGVYPHMEMLPADGLYSQGVVALLGLIFYIVFYFGALSAAHVGAFQIALRLRVMLADKLTRLPMGKVQSFGSGRLQKTMNGNVGSIQSYIAHQIPELIVGAFMPLFLLGLIFSVDFRYAIACLVGLGSAYYFSVRSNAYGEGGAKNMMDVYMDAIEELNNETVEYVRGIQVVRSFSGNGVSEAKLYRTIKEYTRLVIPYTLVWEKYRCVFSSILHNLYLFLIPVGVYLCINGGDCRKSVSELIFYLVLTPAVSMVVPKLTGVAGNIFRCEGAIQRLDRILLAEEMKEPENEEVVKDASVEFSHVTFSYGDEKTALEDISFQVKEGSVTALVGASGGGKSTIAGLLARFWNFTEGNIRVGQADIRSLSFDTLMKQVSFVFQSPHIFAGTVEENIKCGKTDASMEEVVRAAKAACCHDFILQLSEGYQTKIGSGGRSLSGGEKQRIAIARAILKNAPILVLDEATAASDPENEYEIQCALTKAMKNKTVLMIAHRLSSVRFADQILVLEDGKLIEHGTHEELMEKQGRYMQLVQIYEQAVNWKIRKTSTKK